MKFAREGKLPERRGGMAEWLNAPASKAGRPREGSRGFKSLSLRHAKGQKEGLEMPAGG